MRLLSSIAAVVLIMLSLSACSECSDKEVEEKRLQAIQFIAVNDKARVMAIDIANCLNRPVQQVQAAAGPAPETDSPVE